MLIPELPAYLSSMGGGEYKGFIIGLFTLTAGLSRPFSGKLTDTLGRVPVMAIGSVVCVVCSLLYPVLTTVAGFLLLRLFHGFSTGFKPTATAAYIADVIPQSRWGEAMGIHGIFFSTGMAIGPALGSLITSHYSFNWLFYCSALFALMSIVIIFNVPETHPSTQRFRFGLLRLQARNIIEPRVFPAALITLLGYISYGVVLTLIPDWSAHLGIRNKGSFFIVFTLSSLLVRFMAGKLSDRKGRVFALRLALAVYIVASLMIAFAHSPFWLLAAGFMYGIGSGFFSPATSAWTADLSDDAHRGRGIATMYIALEAGIGMGALAAGWVFQDRLERVPWIFGYLTLTMVAGLLYLLHYQRRQRIVKS